MTETNEPRRGRHRAKSGFRKAHAIALVGITAVGLGITAGTASADPTAQDWANIRQCESGGNYSTNTGNGYYGAYQFDLGTWQSMGGSGLPSNASPATQDALALALWRSRGWSPWACASMVSLSDGTAPAASPPRPAAPKTPYAKMSAAKANPWAARAFATLLHRSGGSNYAAQLRAGWTTKRIVATRIANSSERKYAVTRTAFIQCIHRAPSGATLKTYAAKLNRGSLGGLYVSLCSTPASIAHNHNNLASWVRTTFLSLTGRKLTAAQTAHYVAYAHQHGRPNLVKAIVHSSNWQTRQLDSVYRSLLGRSADGAARHTYAAAMMGRGVFTVPVVLALSAEFARKA